MKTMKRKEKIIIIFIMLLILTPGIVKASTYTTTNNLFENSYTNNLIDMAQSQIQGINNKQYVIMQENENYYLISSKKENVEVNNNKITMKKAEIIKAIRTNSGYNYFYEYSKSEEETTTINVNNIVVSNINIDKAVDSKRFEEYKGNKAVQVLLVFTLGLVFAIFLTKERNY